MIRSMMPLVTWAAEFLPETAREHIDFEPSDEKEKPAAEAEGPSEAT